jgi:hypothetical protein
MNTTDIGEKGYGLNMSSVLVCMAILKEMINNNSKKNTIKKILKWAFSGVTIFFIVMLVVMIVHDIMTGESSNTAEYCAKYGSLASSRCW